MKEKVILCKFHIMKYFNKVSDLDIKNDNKKF